MPNAFEDRPQLLDEVVAAAEAAGLAEGRELREVMTSAWTTSSEMLGEIGQVLVRMSKRQLPAELRKQVADALREVRRVWPRLGKAWWQW